jgi:uncharacterized delta-60 repeat protein
MARIARLNSDGTLDPSFNPGSGPDKYYIRALARDAAGNIYVGGEFSAFNGVPHTGVVKLTPTGAVDNVFNPANAGPFDLVNLVTSMTSPDSSGHIVIGGSFRNYNGTNMRGIARFDITTGAIDSTFNAGGAGFTGGSGTVFALRQAPDGKYYVGGSFSSYNGVTRRGIARLNSNGSLDTTFTGPFVGSGDTVYALALQNGKVYAGGSKSSGAGGIFVRLTDTGVVDSSLVTGTGFEISPLNHYAANTRISALTLQPDGKLLVGGIFNRYNGTSRICLARLTGPVVVPPTPTPTATPSPATPTPTPSPTATPASARAMNISTRTRVQTGDQVGIGGFIITGSGPKQVLLRGIGPSLAQFGVPNPLADPVMELHGPAGFVTITNDNWRDGQDMGLGIIGTGLAPSDDLESALLAALAPGAYTAIVKGKNNTTGVGMVEVYDLGSANSQLANISTRGFVGTGDNVMIGGFILGGGADSLIEVLGLGPSLAGGGVSGGVLADPTLELRNSNGALVASNDNCGAMTIHPLDPAEACIETSLPTGAFTAILAGKNGGTGVGLLEIYNRQ